MNLSFTSYKTTLSFRRQEPYARTDMPRVRVVIETTDGDERSEVGFDLTDVQVRRLAASLPLLVADD